MLISVPITFPSDVEDLVQSYVKVGEGEEQAGSALVEPKGRLSDAGTISKGDNVEDQPQTAREEVHDDV